MNRQRALLSVSDKTGIVDLARDLVSRGWEILSTGGTATALRGAGVEVTDVSRITGHPEILDGRVKTLHPAVHGPLLARYDLPEDRKALEELGYGRIDLVAVNLYPFRETIAGGGILPEEAMEKVDIGGPTMIRAAAKNHAHLWVVVDPLDYPMVLEALDSAEETLQIRRRLAVKVFRHMTAYDRAVAEYLEKVCDASVEPEEDRLLPRTLRKSLTRVKTLRYGENPDQEAAFYAAEGGKAGVAGLRQLHGKELSYNNFLDLDGALLTLAPFAFTRKAAAVIVKHTTPCGVALGETPAEAYRKALETDPVSAFGSVIVLNREVDAEAAEAISGLFVECLAAPSFTEEARAILERKKNVRLLVFPDQGVTADHLPIDPVTIPGWAERGSGFRATASFLASHGRLPRPRVLRGISGGVLVQSAPIPPFEAIEEGWRVVSKREPTREERDDLRFAWAAVAGVKSNAILLAARGATLGIGAGQMSRVDSSRIAVRKAEEAGLDLAGAVLASDAFFPFRDGVDAAAEAGVRAIIQPGGSVRDEEVIAAADEHGIAMVFTGRRLFRH